MSSGAERRAATMALGDGPNFQGRQQWGILDNGRKLDPTHLVGDNYKKVFGS